MHSFAGRCAVRLAQVVRPGFLRGWRDDRHQWPDALRHTAHPEADAAEGRAAPEDRHGRLSPLRRLHSPSAPSLVNE